MDRYICKGEIQHGAPLGPVTYAPGDEIKEADVGKEAIASLLAVGSIAIIEELKPREVPKVAMRKGKAEE